MSGLLEPAVQTESGVAEFRRRYRATEIGRRYNGWLHFSFTTVGSLSAIVFALSSLRDVTPLELLTVPAAFIVANFGEYFGHRGPMHHPQRGLRLLFKRHTRQHHVFYTHDAMEAESSTDFHMVLFPPVLLVFFLGCLATPMGLLLYWLASANVGWLFAATAVGYFLTYEWLHFAYHLPRTSWVARLPFMDVLRQHHTVHHDQRLMGRWNFNITFPIADLVMGTYYRDP